MELKVFKDTIASYGGRWETRLELPVETEILIPDYLPAVFKIVKCLIAPVVLQNRVAGGRWQVEGYLRCTVFYQSEEPGTRLLRTEQKFAFEKSVELPAGQYAEGPAQVWGEPEYCNCRAVSEHRIDLRGAYILCAAVAVRKELELLTSLADCGIEQYTRTMQGLQCAVTEEKTLTAETVAALPGAGESVLDITGSFAPGGVTLATGQASVQGTLQIQICSQNADSGELTVRSKELPIQQNLELPGAAEDDTALVRGRGTGLHFKCRRRRRGGRPHRHLEAARRGLAQRAVQRRGGRLLHALQDPDRADRLPPFAANHSACRPHPHQH